LGRTPLPRPIEGTPRPLPAAIDLSAYRVAQEALTNTLKHAGPAQAQLTICYGPDTLEVTAIDNGHGPRPSDETGAGRAAPLWTAGSSAAGDGPHSPTGRPGADGPGSGTPESRHGLVGMHERVRLFGGDLEAGAARDGGFRVAARFPLHGVAR
jgi:signal transduction histidine kinase